ncbi:hypothetical protein ABH931_002700 [Streptacidiphilus sp. MAP12-33]
MTSRAELAEASPSLLRGPALRARGAVPWDVRLLLGGQPAEGGDGHGVSSSGEVGAPAERDALLAGLAAAHAVVIVGGQGGGVGEAFGADRATEAPAGVGVLLAAGGLGVVTLQHGTIRREPWRLLTSLTDPELYPASRLVARYHERWQAETAYASLKAALLDGRVLRSGHPADLEQEAWGLPAVYQALIRTAADAASDRPGLDMDRLSFTVALHAARHQVTTATDVLPDGPARLVGAIGHALLDNLLPARRRERLKARSLKSASKYVKNTGKHPESVQKYTLRAEISAAAPQEQLAPGRQLPGREPVTSRVPRLLDQGVPGHHPVAVLRCSRHAVLGAE